MQHEWPEDLTLAAENRQRRRVGQPALAPVDFQLTEYHALDEEFQWLALGRWPVGGEVMPKEVALLVRANVTLWHSLTAQVPSAGGNARAIEQLQQQLAELRALITRADGTREPGEDDE